ARAAPRRLVAFLAVDRGVLAAVLERHAIQPLPEQQRRRDGQAVVRQRTGVVALCALGLDDVLGVDDAALVGGGLRSFRGEDAANLVGRQERRPPPTSAA